jgi:hypothetical protein
VGGLNWRALSPTVITRWPHSGVDDGIVEVLGVLAVVAVGSSSKVILSVRAETASVARTRGLAPTCGCHARRCACAGRGASSPS